MIAQEKAIVTLSGAGAGLLLVGLAGAGIGYLVKGKEGIRAGSSIGGMLGGAAGAMAGSLYADITEDLDRIEHKISKISKKVGDVELGAVVTKAKRSKAGL